ncbi:hypothetical protein MNBD_GAMMA11-1658 [hydrothermal vent metagenome]|uniref:PEP-CTERM protein-sorting domain-containing protein n=1 Tax=hydrothermal vent metagenome TaxID=652676 RepID=A0A3B0X3G4_9ZZZZ
MKKIFQTVIVAVCLSFPLYLSANEINVGPHDITISPFPITTEDFLTAEISGYLPTPNFTLDGPPSVSITGNTIDISFSLSPPGGANIQVLDPFSFTVDLGKLDDGFYSLNANFLINKKLSKLKYKFEVAPVPVPAAVWLFLSGIVSLFSFARLRERNSSLSASAG